LDWQRYGDGLFWRDRWWYFMGMRGLKFGDGIHLDGS